MRRFYAVISGILLSLVTPQQSLAEAMTFTGLGRLPNSDGGISAPFAVSADGSVIVGMCDTVDGRQAFRWTEASGMVGLEPLPGESDSSARGVSADGSIAVGRSYSDVSGPTSACFWNAAGDVIGLGGDDSSAIGISADGTVVVGSATFASGREAFRWTSAGGMVGLGDLPGGDHYSLCGSVSADASTVVGMGSSDTGREAFRWTSEGGMEGLGVLPEMAASVAVDVSADGTVVVGECGGSRFQWEAFRWTADSGMVGLGFLPPEWSSGASQRSWATGVSDDGAVILGTVISSGSRIAAVVCTPDSGWQNVYDLLIEAGVTEVADWTLGETFDVSADGRVIVGHGINPEGLSEAWAVTLPEPGSGLLLAMGGFAGLWRRRWRCD